jgi:hypothetical protein
MIDTRQQEVLAPQPNHLVELLVILSEYDRDTAVAALQHYLEVSEA